MRWRAPADVKIRWHELARERPREITCIVSLSITITLTRTINLTITIPITISSRRLCHAPSQQRALGTLTQRETKAETETKTEPCTRSSSANKSSRVKVLRSTCCAHSCPTPQPPVVLPDRPPSGQPAPQAVGQAGWPASPPEPALPTDLLLLAERQVRTRSGAERHQVWRAPATKGMTKNLPS